MKSDLLRQIRGLFSEKNVRLNKKLLIFLFFLLLSSTIWLLNALDKNYIANIKYPVTYYNFPDKYSEINELPRYLTLKVDASGYFLLKQKISSRISPIEIDISNYLPNNNIIISKSIEIKSSSFLNEIYNQIAEQVKIIDIIPNNILLSFQKKYTKVVKIIPKITIKPQKQFTIKNVKTIPNKILITGPANILDTLNVIFTDNYSFNNVNEKLSNEIELKPIKNIAYSTNKVLLQADAEKFTEYFLYAPVYIVNKPDSLNIQLEQNQVKVNYCVGLSDFKHVNNSQFKFVADYNEVNKNSNGKLSVLLKEYPSFLFNVNYSPKTINYVIKIK